MPRKQRPMCSICLEPVRGRDMCFPNPCVARRHRHHQACMDKWRKERPGAQCVVCCAPPPPPFRVVHPPPAARAGGVVEIAPGLMVYPCPRCGVLTERIGGCDRVDCPICETRFIHPVDLPRAVFMREKVHLVVVLLLLLLVAPFLIHCIWVCYDTATDGPGYRARQYVAKYGSATTETRSSLRARIEYYQAQLRALDALGEASFFSSAYCLYLLVVAIAFLSSITILAATPPRFIPRWIRDSHFYAEVTRM